MSLKPNLTLMDYVILFSPVWVIGDAKVFIEMLYRNGIAFHFEDDVKDIIWSPEAQPSPSELEALQLRVEEMYRRDFDWGDHDCPIGYALELLHKQIDEVKINDG